MTIQIQIGAVKFKTWAETKQLGVEISATVTGKLHDISRDDVFLMIFGQRVSRSSFFFASLFPLHR
jgi:hypothetical protein